MLEAIAQELRIRRSYLGGTPVQSVYLGGGTPSLLASAELDKLLTLVAQNFSLSSQPEITLEANPDDITSVKLRDLKNTGVNRLSIGVQSFEDSTLRYLNRAHNSAQAISSVELAIEAGFNNLSIDLMYAIPGSSHTIWEANLDTALRLGPQHIAAYCLTIETGTVFGHWYARGKLKTVDEGAAIRQFETLISTLTAHRYEHYEIASFGQPNYHARHNTNYWKQGPYLGVGPGAHSYDGITRQHNVAHNHRYIDSLRQGVVPCKVEILTRENHINEYVMTGLRTQWGCDMAKLKRAYDHNLEETKSHYLKWLVEQELAIINDHKLLLTWRGMLLADQIAADLFVD